MAIKQSNDILVVKVYAFKRIGIPIPSFLEKKRNIVSREGPYVSGNSTYPDLVPVIVYANPDWMARQQECILRDGIVSLVSTCVGNAWGFSLKALTREEYLMEGFILLTLFIFRKLQMFFSLSDVLPLKNVTLTIEPEVVQRYNSSRLWCSYDLEGQDLYAVKWYRGSYEFYRYTPSEVPSTKVFPIGGITVDESRSNSTQVVLRDIEFNLSGNFSCEVTIDQTFITMIDSRTMLVVQLPEYSPKISVSRDPFDYGDTLKANCSTPPSRPRASLKFILNNLIVASTEPLTPRQYQETEWSDLALDMVLSEYHFNEGRLVLRCIADIDDIYHEEAALRLASAREPKPERVSAFDSADAVRTLLQLVLICYVTAIMLS
ncbi:hypothetical protein NQ315_011433 [Exocentrus adspersus]|uniref:Ig-like domain-containing protein n=1 Tax=Exocentrus adspersus TaxID=1586481 RepID=A0AAV8VV10_9CUCU|nr:hypothetical protein NQ315_011433 [Exocentrus adspersus]